MKSYLNCSVSSSEIWSSQLVLALGIPQLIINAISAIFNCGVIIIILSTKDLHKPIFILFCNLAFSDLLTSSSGFWISMLFITDPESTIFGSKDVLTAYVFYTISILSTIYNLVSIGMERFLAVAESLRWRCQVSRNQSLAAALISWALALFLGCIPLVGWNCLHNKEKLSALYSPFCVDYLIFITIPNFLVAFVLPLYTYLSIIVILRKQKVRMEACGQVNGIYKSAEVQVARTSVFIWLLALVSYAPLFAGVLFDAANSLCPTDLHPSVYVFRNCTSMMITMNSLGNPIIYTLQVKMLGRKLKFLKCPNNHRIHVQVLGNL
ncbi:lysophosphatidic acid receptor 1-A-like [Carettochelys insculpta]|uniref:lysophosphatidic acid receptor 1-A-like n=1 Tax=Carettochelys insculpta TaxID=44489 RepID=UPI003EBF5065